MTNGFQNPFLGKLHHILVFGTLISFASQIDIVSLVIENQIPLFLTDMENSRHRLWEGSRNEPTPDVPIEDMFALFRRTKTLLDMYKAVCSKFVV